MVVLGHIKQHEVLGVFVQIKISPEPVEGVNIVVDASAYRQ